MGENTIREAILEAMGEASMCWSNPEGAGEFDSDKAAKVGEELLCDIKDKIVALLIKEG